MGTTPDEPKRRVAIVAGGDPNDREELTLRLAGNGLSVAIVYLDDQEEAESIVDRVLASGGAAVAIRADLGDDLDVERLFAETTAAFGSVDLLTLIRDGRDATVLLRQAAGRLRPDGILEIGSVEPHQGTTSRSDGRDDRPGARR